MERSTWRMLTTHVGSLPRPPDLLAMILAKEQGGTFDAGSYADLVKSSVAEVVKKAVRMRHRHRRRWRDGPVRVYPLRQ